MSQQTWDKVHSGQLDDSIAGIIAQGGRITQVVQMHNGYEYGLLYEAPSDCCIRNCHRESSGTSSFCGLHGSLV